MMASNKAITKRWLDKDPPSVGEWSAIVKDLCEMEKITFSKTRKRKNSKILVKMVGDYA